MINKLTHYLGRATRGFTLIETLVAVLILATAIAGPLTVASKGLQSALIAKDQTTAYYLAQDAVEYVRFARDSNKLGSADWLSGSGSGSTDMAPCVSADGSAACYIDSLSQSPTVPTACSGTCPKLNYYLDPNSNIGQFTYSSLGGNVTPTIFTRAVSIATPVGTNAGEATLTVTVSWVDTPPGVTHVIKLQESVYNWQ